MDDRRIGTAIRALRLKRGWTQDELALRSRTSRWTVMRVERGLLGTVHLDRLRAIAAALDSRLDVLLRWSGGELDRLLGTRHAAMHELIARRLAAEGGWIALPEVSFSIYGERGIIDVLAWSASAATVLVIELKTEIVDINELLGTLDKKRRLARTIAAEHGWPARHVAAWLVVAESRTNRRRLEAHRTLIRAVLPDPPRRADRWLHEPSGEPLAVLTFLSDVHGSRSRSGLATPKRVSRQRVRTQSGDIAVKRACGARLATRRRINRS